MATVVESISNFIESTPTPAFLNWLDMEAQQLLTQKADDSDDIEEITSEDMNTDEDESNSSNEDYDEIRILPSSFDELAEDSVIYFHRGLAENWNEYFVQVGDWLVSATEGADSHPDSENEEEGKAGFASGLSFNLSGVSSRASASAKTVGSFFSTAFTKAGESVKVASSKIQGVVEKNPLLSEFNKEQEAFIKAKGGKVGEALPPWVGYPEEEKLKEEIMSLSTERRNFVRSPPTGVSFEFELEQFLPVAQATLAADPNLEKMRFELVPKTINEETFWRNYFYRVGLIRQSTELSSLEKEGTETTNQTENEPTKGEEDWEAELREELGADLGDYEVVSGTNKDNEQWEEEIQNMIDDEDSADLR